MDSLTDLLRWAEVGNSATRDGLFAVAYTELHQLARAQLRHSGSSKLMNTTVLLHESYLRFARVRQLRAKDRRAFFAYAAQVMRSVIVSAARERITQKRGGHLTPLSLSTEIVDDLAADETMVVNVHEALEVLEKADERLAQVAQLRYFGGYSECEIAEAFGVTERTVQRDWEKARLILAAAMTEQ